MEKEPPPENKSLDLTGLTILLLLRWHLLLWRNRRFCVSVSSSEDNHCWSEFQADVHQSLMPALRCCVTFSRSSSPFTFTQTSYCVICGENGENIFKKKHIFALHLKEKVTPTQREYTQLLMDPRKVKILKYQAGQNRGFCVCTSSCWGREWKRSGGVFSNYSAPLWQKSGECEPNIRQCRGSRFSTVSAFGLVRSHVWSFDCVN